MTPKQIATTVALCVFSVSFAHADSSRSPQELLKQLTGTWEIEDGVNQGVKLSEEELEGTTMVIQGKTIVTYDKDQNETYRALFTLDTSKKPIQIDMTTQMKRVPPSKALGILKFDEDDEFQIAYALPGADRPAEFKSPEGSKIMLFKCEQDD